MAYSYVDIPAMGAGQTQSIPFPYAAQSHIHVYINGVEVSSSLFHILNGTQLVTHTGFPSGTGRIRRQTPINAFESIQNGTSALDWEGMQANFTITEYILQESIDAEDERNGKMAGLDGIIAGVRADVDQSLASATNTLSQALAALNSAQAAAASALSSAQAAAQFDTSAFYTKVQINTDFYSRTQSDSRYYSKTQMDTRLADFATTATLTSELDLRAPKADPTFTGRVVLPEEDVIRAASNTGLADLQFQRANQTLAGRVVWNGQYNTFQIAAYSASGSLTSLLVLSGGSPGMEFNGSTVLTVANLSSYLPNPTVSQVAAAYAQLTGQSLSTYHISNVGSGTYSLGQVVSGGTIGASVGSWRCMSVTTTNSLWMRYI